MEKIYKLREAKEDIVRAKKIIKRLLDEIQAWNTKDLRVFPTHYLRIVQDVLNEIKDGLRQIPSDEAIQHRAEVIHDAIGDYILDNRKEVP